MYKILKQLLFLFLISVICVDEVVLITSGSDANIVNFPYTVGVYYGTQFYCGGAILNKNTILTAAGCVYYATSFSIRAGSTLHSSGGQFVSTTAVYVHPLWNITTRDYNLAILKVPDLIFSDKIQPIALPLSLSDVPTGTSVTLTGWGEKIYNVYWADIMQVGYMPIVDRASCIAKAANATTSYFKPVVNDRHICAGNVVSACNGDLGGPLVWNNVLVGTVSWGINPCGTSGYPTYFMRISYFLDFIGTYL